MGGRGFCGPLGLTFGLRMFCNAQELAIRHLDIRLQQSRTAVG